MKKKYEDNFIEKRRAQRLRFPVKIQYRFLKGKSKWEKADINDISGLGLGISAKGQLKIKDQLEIAVSAKNMKKPVTAKTKVVWCLETASGHFRAGLEIINVQDPARFIELICSKMLDLP